MNRLLFKRRFLDKKLPPWICPVCNTGILKLREDTFLSEELQSTKRLHGHEEWDIEWIKLKYACILDCSNDHCNEFVINIGKGSVDIDYEYDNHGNVDQEVHEIFFPEFFSPALNIIAIPETTPNSVRAPLLDSFKLFFINPSSAVNLIRVALEEILTDLQIKRFEKTNGKRRILSLHQRIILLPSKFDQLKEFFLATKWIGNTGSHSGILLSHDDALDAFELLEFILSETYSQTTKNLKKIAKQINKKKGPSKRSR